VKEFRWYVQPFWYKARVWQTDRQTDRQTDIIAVAYTRILPRVKRKNRKSRMQKKSSSKLYKNYKKNIIEWFYALYRYILLKFHRQVPAPGPNFSVAGHRTCQDRAWRRPCKWPCTDRISYASNITDTTQNRLPLSTCDIRRGFVQVRRVGLEIMGVPTHQLKGIGRSQQATAETGRTGLQFEVVQHCIIVHSALITGWRLARRTNCTVWKNLLAFLPAASICFHVVKMITKSTTKCYKI